MDGNGPGNRKSIAIEICESGDREKTLGNAILLAAKILKIKKMDATKLRTHSDWAIKTCPRILIDPKERKSHYHTWQWFVSEVSKKLKK